MVRFKDIPEEELFLSGSTACQGCPSSLALRIAFKALGKNTILVVVQAPRGVAPLRCVPVLEYISLL